MVKLLSFLQLQNCRLLISYTTGTSRMVPKTGELHRFSFFLKGTHRYLCQSIKSVMTARVIELGSRASYTLRARSTPQHLSLGNVPDICGFEILELLQISELPMIREA